MTEPWADIMTNTAPGIIMDAAALLMTMMTMMMSSMYRVI